MSLVENLIGKTIQLDGTYFDIVEPNNGNEACISLSDPKTKLFLRHKNGRIQETGPDDNPDYFPNDSSFVPEEWESDGFVLHCSNPGLENQYICKIDEGSFIVNPDLEKFVFNITSATNDNASTIIVQSNPNIGKYFELNGSRYDMVDANNGDPECISLCNPKTKLFLRHKNNTIFETGPDDNPDYFPMDSSFVPEESQNDALILHCSNPGMEHLYICHEKGCFVVSPDAEPYCFHRDSQSNSRLYILIQGTPLLGKCIHLLGVRYEVVAANNGNAQCISLHNPETKLFLRHKNSKVVETGAEDNPQYFPLDSSFVPVEKGNGFVLHCSNPGLEHLYCCKDNDGYIVSKDLEPYVFPFGTSADEDVAEPYAMTDLVLSHANHDSVIQRKSLVYNGLAYDVMPANNGDSACISLFNPKTSRYLRHKLNKIVETDSDDNPQYFPMDSSFVPEERDDGYILRCSNTGMKRHALCHTPENTCIVNPDLLEYVFHVTPKKLNKASETTASYSFFRTLFKAASALSITDKFPVDTYLSNNPDARRSRQDPIWHYVTQGFSKGLNTNDTLTEALVLLHVLCPENPLQSFLNYLKGPAADYVRQGLGDKLKRLLMTARIDILPVGTSEEPVKLIPEGIPEPFATFPGWLKTPEGNGCMIESNTLKTNCLFQCENNGKVRFIFRGRDQRKRNEPDVRFPVWIRYEQLEIIRNGECVQTIREPFVASHDAAKQFFIDVAHKDIIGVNAQWTPCFHSKRLIYTMMQSLDENVEETEQIARFAV